MSLTLDHYAHMDSPIHRWDPRFKLIGFLALIFAFSFVRELHLLPAMLLVTVCTYVASGLPGSFILGRLRYPSLFLLVVVLILPFVSGDTVLFGIGPLDVHEEGLKSAVLIATRFLCILTVGLIMFGTAPFVTSVKAMRALGLPAIMADVVMLAFRYLFEIEEYLHRMEIALRLRGFRSRRLSIRGFSTLAWLGGSILVRSYERSEWVYRAMIMRGYGQATISRSDFKSTATDIILFGVVIIVAVAFVVWDILL